MKLLDGFVNLDDKNDSTADDSPPGLPSLTPSRTFSPRTSLPVVGLESIVERVEENENGLAADFAADADEHQRQFIECPAENIRLLAPAGSVCGRLAGRAESTPDP